MDIVNELLLILLEFSKIEDNQLKLNSYFALEVLFASRRFDGGSAPVSVLKTLLDNSESPEQLEDESEKINPQIKVIAYMQALTQTMLNISTDQAFQTENILKLISATISTLSEYLLDGQNNIRQASSSAIKLLITQSVARINNITHVDGKERLIANILYLISPRF